MKPIVFLIALLTSACASKPALVERAPTTEIAVPVVVKCIDVKDIPVLPKTVLKTGLAIDKKAAGVGADLTAWESYGAKADALIRKCAN
jgi:hypothetical protein